MALESEVISFPIFRWQPLPFEEMADDASWLPRIPCRVSIQSGPRGYTWDRGSNLQSHPNQIQMFRWHQRILTGMANVSQPIIRPKHISRNKPWDIFNLQTVYLFVHVLPSRVPSGGQTKKLKDVSPVSSLFFFYLSDVIKANTDRSANRWYLPITSDNLLSSRY